MRETSTGISEYESGKTAVKAGAELLPLPVAAFPVTGPVDVVRHGQTGFLDDDLSAACWGAIKLNGGAPRRYAESRSWRRSTDQFVSHLAPRKPPPSEIRVSDDIV